MPIIEEQNLSDLLAGRTVREQILLAILEGRQAVRLGQYSWRWESNHPALPSLANRYVSVLFRANLVEKVEGTLRLTAPGRVLAKTIYAKSLEGSVPN